MQTTLDFKFYGRWLTLSNNSKITTLYVSKVSGRYFSITENGSKRRANVSSYNYFQIKIHIVDSFH